MPLRRPYDSSAHYTGRARVLCAGALALTLASASCANSPKRAHANVASPADVERTLVAQADAWDKAIVRKDRAGIEANVAPGFFHIGGDGSIDERAAFIHDLMDPELTILPYAIEGLAVHLFGDTALLTGTTHMTGTYKGKPFESHYRYIDTYVRANGRWQVVAVQITKLPPK